MLVSYFENNSKWQKKFFYFFEWLGMNWWISLQELKLMTGIEIEVNLCRKWEWSGVCLTGIEMRSKLRMFVSNWDRSWVYSSGLEIQVGCLTGIQIKKLAFQLVAFIKRYSFKSYYTYLYVNEIRKQNAGSTYSLQIPLTFCGFDLQFADSADSCGFRNSSIQLYTCLVICVYIPQIFLDSEYTVADSANSPNFGAILNGTVFKVFVCGIQNSKEDRRKVAILRIPRQILFGPVAESAYNAQNGQFGLVMFSIYFMMHTLKFFTLQVLANCFSVMVYLKELFVTQDLSFLEIFLFKKK